MKGVYLWQSFDLFYILFYIFKNMLHTGPDPWVHTYRQIQEKRSQTMLASGQQLHFIAS